MQKSIKPLAMRSARLPTAASTGRSRRSDCRAGVAVPEHLERGNGSVASHPRRCGIPALRNPGAAEPPQIARRGRDEHRHSCHSSRGSAGQGRMERHSACSVVPGSEENRRAIKGDRAGPCCFAKKRYAFDDWPTGPGTHGSRRQAKAACRRREDVIASCVVHPGEECTEVKSWSVGSAGVNVRGAR
jgi:hypothetical protein